MMAYEPITYLVRSRHPSTWRSPGGTLGGATANAYEPNDALVFFIQNAARIRLISVDS